MHFWPYWQPFPLDNCFFPSVTLEIPTGAAEASYSEYQLPPPPWHRQTSIITIDDESVDSNEPKLDNQTDDAELLITHSLATLDNSASHTPSDGKLCEAPTINIVLLALWDLNEKLCGLSWGKGGGYKTPDLDHFVQIRSEERRVGKECA